MAFTRPALSDLVTRIQGDFISRLGLTAPLLRRAFVYVAARVWAGAAHLMHGHLDYLSRQVFPDLSDPDFLLRQAALAPGGAMSPTPAAFATGPVTLTGTNGTVVGAGAVLQRADGTTYATIADATIASAPRPWSRRATS